MDLMVFDYGDRKVRTVIIDGEPWFVAKDVIEALGLGNVTETLKRLDEDEFSSTEVVDSAGRKQEMYIVNEPGLYSIILGARSFRDPERAERVKKFKRWVTHEVLPSIRKTGSYSLPSTPMAIEDLIILQAQSVKELKAKVAELEEKTKVAMARIDMFDNVNIIGDPKQRLNAMVRKYAARNGLTYQQGWRDFRTAFNVAYRTNITLLMEHHKAKHGLKTLTMPEYLERVGRLDDALRVADKMLNPPSGEVTA